MSLVTREVTYSPLLSFPRKPKFTFSLVVARSCAGLASNGQLQPAREQALRQFFSDGLGEGSPFDVASNANSTRIRVQWVLGAWRQVALERLSDGDG